MSVSTKERLALFKIFVKNGFDIYQRILILYRMKYREMINYIVHNLRNTLRSNQRRQELKV